MFLFKVVLIFLIVLLLVLFALANAHHAPVSLLIGGPVNIKLIYLMLGSYFFGLITAAYFFLLWKMNKRKKASAEEDEDE